MQKRNEECPTDDSYEIYNEIKESARRIALNFARLLYRLFVKTGAFGVLTYVLFGVILMLSTDFKPFSGTV
ncbi:MAG: hypothetical protein LBN25_02760, partial [Christensenellaceae bacterium]|nr:hypothetical protein [Christensenellaceae bacterium]